MSTTAQLPLAEAVERAAQDVRQDVEKAGMSWGNNNRQLRQTKKRVGLAAEMTGWRVARQVLISRLEKYGWDYETLRQHVLSGATPRVVILPDRFRRPLTMKISERP